MDWHDVLHFVTDLFYWGDAGLFSWQGLLIFLLLLAVVVVWISYGPVAGGGSLVAWILIYILVNRRLLS